MPSRAQRVPPRADPRQIAPGPQPCTPRKTTNQVAVTATVALVILAVAEVVFLSVSERAPEQAAILTFGWRESALSRLVISEGGIIGLVGSLAAAALGLVAAAQFAGQLPATLYLIAAAAVVAGLLVTTTAALLLAQALRRPPARRGLAVKGWTQPGSSAAPALWPGR